MVDNWIKTDYQAFRIHPWFDPWNNYKHKYPRCTILGVTVNNNNYCYNYYAYYTPFFFFFFCQNKSIIKTIKIVTSNLNCLVKNINNPRQRRQKLDVGLGKCTKSYTKNKMISRVSCNKLNPECDKSSK